MAVTRGLCRPQLYSGPTAHTIIGRHRRTASAYAMRSLPRVPYIASGPLPPGPLASALTTVLEPPVGGRGIGVRLIKSRAAKARTRSQSAHYAHTMLTCSRFVRSRCVSAPLCVSWESDHLKTATDNDCGGAPSPPFGRSCCCFCECWPSSPSRLLPGLALGLAEPLSRRPANLKIATDGVATAPAF